MAMTSQEKQAILDTLTKEQREGVAKIIRAAEVEGGYQYDSECGSVFSEDATATLENLAHYFESYDPTSVIDH